MMTRTGFSGDTGNMVGERIHIACIRFNPSRALLRRFYDSFVFKRGGGLF